jgi:CyaY protein
MEHFDQIADKELHWLEQKFLDFDPDEVEVELSQGVLTLTLGDDSKIVVNSHHAAGEIWMAAYRQAWHFAPKEEGEGVRWRTSKDELHATLEHILSDKLGRKVQL